MHIACDLYYRETGGAARTATRIPPRESLHLTNGLPISSRIHDDPKDGVLERLYNGFLGQTLKGCRENLSCTTVRRFLDYWPSSRRVFSQPRYNSRPIPEGGNYARIQSLWALLASRRASLPLFKPPVVLMSICYDYSSAVEGCSLKVLKIIDKVRGLRDVLETLEQLARQAEGTTVGAESRRPSMKLLFKSGTGVLAKGLMELTYLDKRLRPPNWSGPAGA